MDSPGLQILELLGTDLKIILLMIFKEEKKTRLKNWQGTGIYMWKKANENFRDKKITEMKILVDGILY